MFIALLYISSMNKYMYANNIKVAHVTTAAHAELYLLNKTRMKSHPFLLLTKIGYPVCFGVNLGNSALTPRQNTPHYSSGLSDMWLCLYLYRYGNIALYGNIGSYRKNPYSVIKNAELYFVVSLCAQHTCNATKGPSPKGAAGEESLLT